MGPLLLLAAIATSAPDASDRGMSEPGSDLSASASARAFVRILPAARVIFDQAEADGYELRQALITTEDGARRQARLVEFE